LYEKDKNPIKPQGQLKKALYNKSRLRKGGRSRRETSMPKFVGDEGMLSYKTLFGKDDPTGSKDLSSIGKLGEAFESFGSSKVNRTALPPDLMSALKKMTNKLNISSSRQVLSESVMSEEDLLKESNDLINKDEAEDV